MLPGEYKKSLEITRLMIYKLFSWCDLDNEVIVVRGNSKNSIGFHASVSEAHFIEHILLQSLLARELIYVLLQA